MKAAKIKIHKPNCNVEKGPRWKHDDEHWKQFTDTQRAHIVNRNKLLLILPRMSRFHFAQPEVSFNFKLPVVHSIQKSLPFNVPGRRQKQRQ